MNIWLLTIGEPVLVDENTTDRLYRTGFLAQLMSSNGWDVTWWTSTFDHFRKRHYSLKDDTVHLSKNLKIVLLYGGGYRSNLSLARIRDHKQIAAKFSKQAPSYPKPDIILCSYPPIELSLTGVRFGSKYHVPVVLDMRDMWPDIFMDHIPCSLRPAAKILATPLFRAASEVCKNATAITGITEAFVNWGLNKGKRLHSSWDKAFPMGYASKGVLDAKIMEVEEFWDNNQLNRDSKDFVACFIGTLGRQLDLGTIIVAARKIGQLGRRIRFVICGTGDRMDYFRKSASDLPHVTFHGWVDAAQIYVLLRRSAVGLDPLPDRYDFLATINNKAIEYMSAGLPVISSPNKGLLHDLLNKYESGMSYPCGDADSLARILVQLYDDPGTLRKMSQNAARLFHEKFMAEKVYAEMMEYLARIAQSSMLKQRH